MTIYHSKKTTALGRIYKKWNRRPDGSTVDVSNWTVRFKGRDYGTGSPDAKVAEKKLLQLAGDASQEKQTGDKYESGQRARPKHVLMDELFDDRDTDSRLQGNKDWKGSKGSADKNLRPFFAQIIATELTKDQINTYIGKRLDEEAAIATVNRELALLKRALNLGVQNEPPKILRFPKIKMLKNAKIRKGFLRHPDYLRLRDRLPDHLAAPFVTAYHVGNRKGELLLVEIQDVEMDAAQPQFRLYPDATKSGDGRVIPIYGDMMQVFEKQIRSARSKNTNWVFHDEKGNRVQTFYKAWNTALEGTNLEGLLFHDLRRTAIRNLIRGGVDRKIAKAITGHKTDSVFDRYDITDEQDLQIAASKMGTYINLLYAQIPPPSALVC